MKAPICDICLRSSILCSACNEKLNSGKITESDVTVSRKLFEVGDRFKALKNITIKRVLETDNTVLIIPGKEDASKMIGRGGMVAKELTKVIGKNVRIIGESPELKEFIEKLIFPVKVSGMNVLYTDSGEAFKIIISDNRRIPISRQTLIDIVKQVYEKDIRIVDE